MPLLRLILFALPFIIGWVVSPIGLSVSIGRIGANQATPLDWVKLGVIVILAIILSMMPKKRD